MNNDQFRRLISSNPSASQNNASTTSKPRSLLGARPKSTNPSSQGRSYSANLFKKTSSNGTSTSSDAKKARTNVPKGTRLAAGYVDRTQGKREDEDEDETAQRLKALEEKVKEGEMEVEEFERLRDEITGGDISRTHLVKGLDRRLLERIRRGENVLEERKKKAADGEQEEGEGDDDDAFDELERHEVHAEKREAKVKQGEKARFAPTPNVAGQKRSRNQILADMKAAREAAKAAARPQLGTGFKKIRKDVEEGPRIEVDERGREVLVTVDGDGNVKRKVRKVKAVVEDVDEGEEVLKKSKSKDVPLGADVVIPKYEAPPAEESDGDIFAGAGHDFNPLADLEDDEDASDAEKKAPVPATAEAPPTNDEDAASEEGEAKEPSAKPPPTTAAAGNYFNDDPTSLSILSNIKNDFSADKLAALSKSQRAQEVSTSNRQRENETEEEAAKRKRREAMLNSAARDRDMEDMDMGFGGSRFDDAEEMAMEGSKVKFSRWTGGGGAGGDDESEGEGQGGKGGGKRKRGPKKRKGDKNSATDVLGEMERQRKG